MTALIMGLSKKQQWGVGIGASFAILAAYAISMPRPPQSSTTPNYNGQVTMDGRSVSATIYNVERDGTDALIAKSPNGVMIGVTRSNHCYIGIDNNFDVSEAVGTCNRTLYGMVIRDRSRNEVVGEISLDWHTDEAEEKLFTEAMDVALGVKSKPTPSSSIASPTPQSSPLPKLPSSFGEVVAVDVVGTLVDPPTNFRVLPSTDSEILGQYTVKEEKVHFTAQSGEWLWDGKGWVHGSQFTLESQDATFVPPDPKATCNPIVDFNCDGILTMNESFSDCTAIKAAGYHDFPVNPGNNLDRDGDGIACES